MHLTRQIHTDKFPQRTLCALNSTKYPLLQFAGDLRRYSQGEFSAF